MILAEFDATAVSSTLTLFAGIALAVAVFFKAPREANNISVTAAEGAVKVQVMLNEALEKSLESMRTDVESLRGEVITLRNELATVTTERDELRRERDELRGRVVHLEERVEALSREQGKDLP